jgi:SSS family transporter
LRHVNGVLIGVLVYVVLQLLVGVVVSRGIRSEADYLVAGRRIGLGLATFSMFATWFGAESCVSAAGKFYAEGLAGGATDPFGYSLALFLMGLLFAVPLWRRGLTTLADLLRQRYSNRVERFAALLMAPTSMFWAAAQIRAFGQVLHASSDWGVVACVTLAAVVVILYTCTGGLLADVITDLVQGIAIIVGLVALLVALGLHPSVSFAEAWRSVDPAKFRLFGNPANSGWATLELWTLTVCGSLVAQEVVARILGTQSAGVARRATLWGGGLYLVIGLVPAFLGLIAPHFLPPLDHPDQVLPRLAEQYLPPFVFILFAGALVSAILSTVDSTLLAASSLVSHNVIVSFKPGMSERNKVRLARGGVVVFGLAAYALALGAESIFELVQQANGIGSAGVFVLVVFGLFSTRGGVWSGLATLVVGLGIWSYGTYASGWTCPYLISLGASLVCFLVVSAWERPHHLTEADPARC